MCDDGKCNYNDNGIYSQSSIIHISKDPENRETKKGVDRTIYIKELDKVTLHFAAVNLDRIYDKKIWYMCFELIRMNEKNPDKYLENAKKINLHYTTRDFKNTMPKDFMAVKLAKSLPEWFNGYNFFDASKYKIYDIRHRKEVLSWFSRYGIKFFEKLDIWYLDWTMQAKKDFEKYSKNNL